MNELPTINEASRRAQALAQFFIDKNIYIHKGASIELFVHPTEVQITQSSGNELKFHAVYKNDEHTIKLGGEVKTTSNVIQGIITLIKNKSKTSQTQTVIVSADPDEELYFTDLGVLDAFSLKLRDDVVYIKTAIPQAIANGVCIQSSDPRVKVGTVKCFTGQLVNRVKLKMIVG